MLKTINVLINLPDFGIVDLPLAYSMRADNNRPGVSIADCEILLNGESLPKWLYKTTFSVAYTPLGNANANMVWVCTDQLTTNRFHEMMLSIVSSYIKLKEDKLCLTQKKLSV